VGEKNKILVYDYFGNYLGSVGDGVLINLTGFSILKNELVAASNDTIWWFTRDGIMQKVSSLEHIITGDRIDQIQDIAYKGDQLFILSQHRIHVFK
jgi:hypothetical protein